MSVCVTLQVFVMCYQQLSVHPLANGPLDLLRFAALTHYTGIIKGVQIFLGIPIFFLSKFVVGNITVRTLTLPTLHGSSMEAGEMNRK